MFKGVLNRRKVKAETRPTANSRADGSGAGASANDRQVDVSIPRLHSWEELEQFDEVLTAPEGKLPIADFMHKEVALLETSAAEVLLVCSDAFYGSQHYMTLLQRAHRSEIAVARTYIASNPGILGIIYDQEQRRALRAKQNGFGTVVTKKAESVETFESIIADAVREGATDIHFLIREADDISTVLFRIDGLLRKGPSYPSVALNDSAGVAFTKLAEEKSRSHPAYNHRVPQNCTVPLSKIAGRNLRLRYTTVPVEGGLDVVLRVLYTDDSNRPTASLPQLGYSPSHQKDLDLAARKTVGTIIIAGVTGSGKSTTLKTLMTMDPERHTWKSYSVEDPAEYKMEGVSQWSVQRTAETQSTAAGGSSNPFAAAMRVLMRADPDVIMVGEVRDQETGSLLKSMVQSGHQVYTTVHAASAPEIIERLTSEEIGLMRTTLSSRNFISALVYQKLIPLTCGECKLPAVGNLPDAYLELIKTKFGVSPESIRIAHPEGCPACKQRGVKGQTVAAEIIVPDSQFLKFLRDGDDLEAEEYWRGSRTAAFDEPDCTGKTAFEHSLYKMSQGLIDPRLIEGSFEPFETYRLHTPKKDAHP
ncbi:hypothetical protein F6X40_10730 [Paraburkholderia sp. UCT31]|uniref:GspE/PulE family protein n=1 Tax=Paraburkholderia sp. UCT31 TaxID=2615209 RepID=UPI0016565B2F|nr:ATPase, T2SS/T4P/T4SS family [Paraburkholderia sp. UCT31]MBC8737283.1 hypothetical protein [Paraburkholderia sp. UCT31]